MNTLEEYLEDFETNNKFTPSVVGYLIKDGKVLLGKRIKVSDNLGQDLVAGIGGKRELGESDDEAFVREAIEEIGTDENGNIVFRPIKIERRGRVRFIFPNKSPKWSQAVEIYICTEWEGEPVKTNVIEPEWYDVNNLPVKNMWEDNKIWLPRLLAGEIIDAVFLYGNDGKISDYKFEQ